MDLERKVRRAGPLLAGLTQNYRGIEEFIILYDEIASLCIYDFARAVDIVE